LLLGAFSACHSDQNSYRVSFDLDAEPLNLDPQTAADTASLTVIGAIFEGLFTLSPLGEIENAVALQHTVSADGLVYTFTLRTDALWAGRNEDGSQKLVPVTAADFVFGLQRLLRPSTHSPAASRFYCIENASQVHSGELPESQLGVYALSDDTLEIRLNAPSDNLLYLLSSTYAMPCNEDFFTSTRGKYGLEPSSIMANGPFDLRSWTHGESVRLAKNESYYAAEAVLPAGVNLWISASPPAERLQKELVDAAMVSGEEAGSLKGLCNLEPVEDAVWGVYVNLRNPDLANENIRLGISGAFDRDAYRDSLPEGLSLAQAIVPHSAQVYGENYREWAGESMSRGFEPELAYEYYRAGLKEQGGSVGRISLLVSSEDEDKLSFFQSASQILQRELSLFVSIETVSASEYAQRLSSGSFDLALCRLAASDNTPWTVLSRFQSDSPQNTAAYRNEKVDALLAQAAGEFSREKTMAAYGEAERLILSDGVFLPMFYSTDYFAVRQTSTGIVYNPCTGLVSFREAALR